MHQNSQTTLHQDDVEEMVASTIRVRASLWSEVRKIAIDRRITVAQFCAEALEKAVSDAKAA